MDKRGDQAFRYCGREFSVHEIEKIRELIASSPHLPRAGLSRIVCDEFGWLRPDGRRKEMSCRVAMIRMDRDGLIRLPAPLRKNGNGSLRPRLTSASAALDPIHLSKEDQANLVVRPVGKGQDSSLWNELIQRYHYLGYKALPGAQIRYRVHAGRHLVALLGFGASAWKVAPRDRFIGWTPEQRKQNLRLVVNNARFLILPWVHGQSLASRILSRVAGRLPEDFEGRYGYRPVLLETFVQKDRFRGTCYRAANWIHVGETQGRGKLDRTKQFALPVKDIFLYPLRRDFRRRLCGR
jgi:hypothetical protein